MKKVPYAYLPLDGIILTHRALLVEKWFLFFSILISLYKLIKINYRIYGNYEKESSALVTASCLRLGEQNSGSKDSLTKLQSGISELFPIRLRLLGLCFHLCIAQF